MGGRIQSECGECAEKRRTLIMTRLQTPMKRALVLRRAAQAPVSARDAHRPKDA